MADLRTPLYAEHLALGARMVPFSGWEMPVQYSSILTEHHAVRTAVGVFDISHMGRLEFTGSDAQPFLDKIVTHSVSTLAVGQIRYALICHDTGGILDDVLVYRWPDGYQLVVNASNRAKIKAWLETHHQGFDVRVEDQTLHTTMLAVQGPKAVQVCRALFPPDVTELKYYFGTEAAYRGQPCLVSRTGYTGEDGFEITVRNDQAIQLWSDLLSEGAVPCGLGARDTLRLEAAMPLYGHELSESINPYQAGLGWAVKLHKGDFIGKAALQELANSPPPTRRVGLELPGKRAARDGSSILLGDRPIGTVTSGSYAPSLNRSIAMGYVESQAAEMGTQVQVDVRGSLIPAVVVKLPFYQRLSPAQ